MLVVRLLLVALLIAVGALALAWLFSGRRKYLGYIALVVRVALVAGIVAALLYAAERLILL